MWGPILIRVVATAPTEREVLDFAAARFDETLERYSAVACLVVTEHGTPLPSGDALRYVRERYDLYGERLVMAYAVLGLGFWAGTAVRLGAALVRASGHTALLDTPLERVCERLSLELVGVDPQALLARVEQLRARVQDRRLDAAAPF